MNFFIRMESSRWNFLGGVGGVVQEKICLEEIYMLSSYSVEIPRWNFLDGVLQGWFRGWKLLAILFVELTVLGGIS